ncbi:unnamed protein product [Coffea canephora]|uniref:BHLH domain-containing protein n=1 Tax=Coffea canephora TaxID=49390 RepID=A0A068TUL3_COFCA|nr:unnamed protein product [Coffea canephora]
MADEFQGEVCGGSWWNSSRSMFGSSPCSSGILHDLGSFGWSTDFLDSKARSSDDQSGNSANSDGSIVIQDLQKPNQPESASNNSNLSIDSTLQILGIGLSSPSTTDWDRTLMHGSSNGRSDQSNYQPMLQEDHNSSMNYRQERGLDSCPADQIQKDWSSTLKNNFSTIVEEDSSINSFKSSGNQPLNSITTTSQCTAATCAGVSTSFPISSASYGYSSTLLQTLFDTEVPQPQQSLYGTRPMNYPSTTSYQNEFSPSLPKFSPLPKLQNTNSLQLSTNPNFCNGSAAAFNDLRVNFFPSVQSQFPSSTFNEKPSLPSITTKVSNDGIRGLGSVAKKSSSEPAFKRPRIETPSPLPTFKVRKEKLGDRITALQQLVSPFGKTDTASVLHEAIDYIKFLHDQVNVLSTPYLKNGSPIQRQQASDKVKDQEGSKEDLKSRGLCLVPISSTFPVAAETTTDFWTPTFGGTFR